MCRGSVGLGSGAVGYGCTLSLGSRLSLVLGVAGLVYEVAGLVFGVEGGEVVVLGSILVHHRHHEGDLRMVLRAAEATKMGLKGCSFRSLLLGSGMVVVRKLLSMGYSHRCSVRVALRPPANHGRSTLLFIFEVCVRHSPLGNET